jgi:hypothetical protein
LIRYGWLVLFLAACTEPSYTSGHLRCASSGRACPDSFFCAEGRCWRDGTDLASVPVVDSGVADLPAIDLAGVTTPDLSTRADLAVGPDMRLPSTTCGTVGVKLCDPFETLGSRWASTTNAGCSVAIDPGRSYRGGTSAHFHCNTLSAAAAETSVTILSMDQLPVSGTLYARVWGYLGAGFPASMNQMINFSNAAGDGMSYSMEQGHPVNDDYTSPKQFSTSTMTTIPTGRWVCFQIQIDQSASSGAVKLFLDGADVTDVDFTAAATPSLTQLYLGLDWFNTPASFPASDLWLDELILDDKPVTCDE